MEAPPEQPRGTPVVAAPAPQSSNATGQGTDHAPAPLGGAMERATGPNAAPAINGGAAMIAPEAAPATESNIPFGPLFPPTKRSWNHFIGTVELLLLQQHFKQDPLMDLFQLGCESLIHAGPAIGKISVEKVSPSWQIPPIDVIVDNLFPSAARLPRYVQKVYTILGNILEDDTNTPPELLSRTLELLCGLYDSTEPVLRAARPYLPFKVLVLLSSTLADDLKNKLYRIRTDFIDAEKEFEQRLQLRDPLVVLIDSLTANHRSKEFLRIELFLKAPAAGPQALPLLSAIAEADRSYEFANGLLDVLVQHGLVAENKPPLGDVLQTITVAQALVAGCHEEEHQVLVCKLLELLRVRLACCLWTQTEMVFRSTLPGLIAAAGQLHNSKKACKALCKMLEAVTVASEMEFPVDALVHRVLSSYVTTAAAFPEPDAILARLLDFAVQALRSKAPEVFLDRGVAQMTAFVSQWPSVIDPREPLLFARVVELGTLLVERRLETSSFSGFWNSMPGRSMEEIGKWRATGPEERHQNARRLLEWGIVTVRSGVNFFKTFVLYFPALLESLTAMPAPLSQPHLLRILAQACEARCQYGDDITNVLSEGIPMVLKIAPRNEEQIKNLLEHLIDRFDTSESYSLILRLTHSWKFARQHFPAHVKEADELFISIIRKGSWQDVKLVYDIFRSEITKEQYQKVVTQLFVQSAVQGLSMRELRAVFNVIWSVMSMNIHKENENIPILTEHLLVLMETNFENKLRRGGLDKELSKLIIYKAVCKEQLAVPKTRAEVLAEFQAFSCPEEVLLDENTMYALSLLGKRIEHVRRDCQKRLHVANLAVQCLRTFLTVEVPEADNLNSATRLAFRKRVLEDLVFNLPQNKALRDHLTGLGYTPALWTTDLEVMVEVDSNKNHDEVFVTSLLKVYAGYVDILKELDVSEVEINGRAEALESVFACKEPGKVNIEDLRGRRNTVVQLMNQRLGSPKYAEERERHAAKKAQLLAQEKQLEAEHKEDKRKRRFDRSQRLHYWARFNKRFLSVLSTTDGNITGCYAPEGDHAEKVIENGLKANTAIISVYEERKAAVPVKGQKAAEAEAAPEAGTEIENVEVLLTDQGLFLFKVYTNGHKKDTALVWAQMLKELVTQRLVPAVIVPANFPSPRIFSLLSHYIQPLIYSSVITYKDSFFDSENIESYYDLKPEKIKQGDILITPDNCHLLDLSGSPGKTVLLSSTGLERQASAAQVSALRLKKDFGGSVTQDIMRKLKADAVFESYKDTLNVFGRFVAQYVSTYLEKGHEDAEILSTGFDVEQWNRRKTKTAKKITPEEKNLLIAHIVAVVARHFLSYYEATPGEVFALDRDHFFELKTHLEVFCRAHQGSQHAMLAQANNQLRQMRDFLKHRVDIVALDLHTPAFQQEVIRWVFRNEDRVWRERGGRPGEETVEMFLDFIKPEPQQHSGHTAFPGVILLSQPMTDEAQPIEIVGYAIGDFEGQDSYEVITAWTSNHYRGVNLAMALYYRIVREFDTRNESVQYIVCDTIRGGYERMVQASPLLRALRSIRLLHWVVRKKEDSYVTELDDGQQEEFERMVLHYPTLSRLLRSYLSLERVWRIFGHRIDPDFKRFVTPSRKPTEQPKKSSPISVSSLLLVGTAGATAYLAFKYLRRSDG